MKPAPRSTRISVRVTPGARKNEVVGWSDGVLRLKIAAPPVDGAANAELVRWLARDVLGVSRGAVRVVSGDKGRDKVLEVDLAAEVIAQALERVER